MILADPLREVGKFFGPAPLGRPRGGADFSAAQIVVLFCVLVLITSIPVITNPLPPLEDYANHLARMSVIANLERDPNLARFYEIDWEIVPNLMMDLTVPFLVRFMSIYAAGQVFLISTFVLIMSGSLALHRALHGRWSILPLIAFPLLYNRVFLIGVTNYQFGIGIALWGMAAWVAFRERHWLLRLALSAVFVVALFFCHLFAVGVYAVGLLAFELWRLAASQRRDLWRVIDFLATGLPFLIALLLLIKSPILRHVAGFEWESTGKIDGIAYTIEVYSDIIAFLLTGVVVAAGIWAARRGLLRFHPVGIFVLGVGGLVYMALPRMLFDTYLADQRLPIALAFMAVACLHLDVRPRMVRRGFIALTSIVLLLRVIEVNVTWTQLSAASLEFREFGETHRARLDRARRLCGPVGRRRHREPRPGACGLSRDHRAIRARDHRLHGRRQADHACAPSLYRRGRHRGRHASDDRRAHRHGLASRRRIRRPIGGRGRSASITSICSSPRTAPKIRRPTS